MQPIQTAIRRAPGNHAYLVIADLVRAGWNVDRLPASGRIAVSGQRLVLIVAGRETRLRLFTRMVSGSARGRPDERRIQVTTTRQSLRARAPGFHDLLLGYDRASDGYVGMDPRRLRRGGLTGTASNFLDREGLTQPRPNEVVIRPRRADVDYLRPLEYHAFLTPHRLAEYLFNFEQIHAGSYRSDGPFSGRVRLRARPMQLVGTASHDGAVVLRWHKALLRRGQGPMGPAAALEAADFERLQGRTITPAQFEQYQRLADENGRLGEAWVLEREKRRLRKAGRPGLAARVEWVSQRSVSAGYDINSFRTDGSPMRIEVKSTSSAHMTFEFSRGEWKAAQRYRSSYYIYHVRTVRSAPRVTVLQDPVGLEASGRLSRVPVRWKVSLC